MDFIYNLTFEDRDGKKKKTGQDCLIVGAKYSTKNTSSKIKGGYQEVLGWFTGLTWASQRNNGHQTSFCSSQLSVPVYIDAILSTAKGPSGLQGAWS